jgi:hypothetical protein
MVGAGPPRGDPLKKFRPARLSKINWTNAIRPSCREGPGEPIVLRHTPKLDARLGIEARMRFGCVILNAFPRSNQMVWTAPQTRATRRHCSRWCSRWAEEDDGLRLQWSSEEIRRYYLFHLFLHEVGHVNQPPFHDRRRREDFAENFALEWAVRLGELPGAEAPNLGTTALV